MRIAILGATSQIAKDLVRSFVSERVHDLVLFARRPEAGAQWLADVGLAGRYAVANFSAFNSDEHFDVILNFVGVGNPAQAAAMGASIFDVTLQYDELALSYVRQHPTCRYIFLSSGAAYGGRFEEPVTEGSNAQVTINAIKTHDWYSIAKLQTECHHRVLSEFSIVDVRIFNYFSHTQDIAARFFITDIIRSIKNGEVLVTSPDNIFRDYIGPDDFYRLIYSIMNSPKVNDVVDCYTLEPVDKFSLLSAMSEEFGLKYEIRASTSVGINATGLKRKYFSLNRRAELFGFKPTLSSLDTVLLATRRYFDASAA